MDYNSTDITSERYPFPYPLFKFPKFKLKYFQLKMREIDMYIFNYLSIRISLSPLPSILIFVMWYGYFDIAMMRISIL